MIRAGAHAEALAALSHDASGLRDYWSRLPEAERVQPEGGARRGAEASWHSAAIARRPRSCARASSATGIRVSSCSTPNARRDAARQLEMAERWLAAHNHDAALLFALGRLCERAQLWGKAQTYYEASLALDNRWRAHLALGELHAKLERTSEANAHLAAALKLALAELGRRAG